MRMMQILAGVSVMALAVESPGPVTEVVAKEVRWHLVRVRRKPTARRLMRW
jgi:hypothetical protein